jgi:hypothetical protein
MSGVRRSRDRLNRVFRDFQESYEDRMQGDGHYHRFSMDRCPHFYHAHGLLPDNRNEEAQAHRPRGELEPIGEPKSSRGSIY